MVSGGGEEKRHSTWSELHATGERKRLLRTDTDTLSESSVGMRFEHVVRNLISCSFSSSPIPFSMLRTQIRLDHAVLLSFM